MTFLKKLIKLSNQVTVDIILIIFYFIPVGLTSFFLHLFQIFKPKTIKKTFWIEVRPGEREEHSSPY
jgi:hypothetical protein